MKTRLERDAAGYLQHLDVDPEMRENMILKHWKQHHCPISTIVSVKTQCPFHDSDGRGCFSWLTPRMYDLKRHLSDGHGDDMPDIKNRFPGPLSECSQCEAKRAIEAVDPTNVD